MNLILKVTSTHPRAPLSQLLHAPLGLDVWEVKPDYVTLRAAEAQAERLQHTGYTVEQVHLTEAYLSTFATADMLSLSLRHVLSATCLGVNCFGAWLPTTAFRNSSSTRGGILPPPLPIQPIKTGWASWPTACRNSSTTCTIRPIRRRSRRNSTPRQAIRPIGRTGFTRSPL